MANDNFDPSIWKKLKNKPYKAFSPVNIPDGEFLRYGNYANGEKHADFYIVTVHEKDAKGNLLYRSYIDAITIKSGRKPTSDHTKWPSYCVVDPKTGSIVESKASFTPDTMKNWSGLGGLTGWHMKIDRERGRVSYVSTRTQNGKVKEWKYDFSAPMNIPIGDMWFSLFFLPRYIDFSGEGIVSMLNPEYFRSIPVWYTLKSNSKEPMKTAAGTFNAIHYRAWIRTTFKTIVNAIRQLMFRPNAGYKELDTAFAYYVDDSDKRHGLKEHTVMGGGDYILEEIRG